MPGDGEVSDIIVSLDDVLAERGITLTELADKIGITLANAPAVIEAGAGGYVLKGDSFDDLARGVRMVMSGQIFLSTALVGIFVEQYRNRGQTEPSGNGSPLTSREREVVQLFSEGHSTNDIADRLHLSTKTVATHREHIFDKLRIASVAELTRYAIREGLSPLESPCRPASHGRKC